MTRRVSFFTFLGFLVHALLRTTSAVASPLDSYGFGARARGMGGAYTAVADDVSALYYNPAALSQRHENLLQVGLFVAKPHADLQLDPAPGISQRKRESLENLERKKTDLPDVQGTEFGVVLSPHERFKAAMGFYAPQQSAVTLRPLSTHEPNFIRYDHYPERGTAFLGASVTIVPGLAVGFGTTVFIKVDGDLYIPLEMRDQKDQTTSQSELENNSELTIEFPWTTQPFAGVFFQPNPRWRFGASYRAQFEWDVKVDAAADVIVRDYEIDLSRLQLASGDNPIKTVIQIHIPALGDDPLEIPLEIASIEGSVIASAQASLQGTLAMVDFWAPQQVTAGGAYDPTDQWTVSLDATWADWSEMDSPEMQILIDDLNVNIQTLPANVRARIQNLTIPVLGTVGPVPPVSIAIPGMDASLSIPVKFRAPLRPPVRDVIHPRIGAEYRFLPMRGASWTGQLDLKIRAGYAYEPSPFETSRGFVNLVDPDRHTASFGLGASFNERFHLDTFFQYRYLEPVRWSKDFVDPDMPFERVRAAGYVMASGLQAGVSW